MKSSKAVRFIAACGRRAARAWQWLGEVDRALERSYVPPDCDYARATSLVADSAIVRSFAAALDRFNAESSVAVAASRALVTAVRRLPRWQLVRLAGIVFTTALAVHVAFYAVLPWRFGPQLPALVWIAVVALGATLIAAPRQFAAAWDEWRR
jgi:hypothetical protein